MTAIAQAAVTSLFALYDAEETTSSQVAAEYLVYYQATNKYLISF